MLTLPHLGQIESKDALLGETLRALQNAINLHGTVSGVDPSGGAYPAPPAPSEIQVTSTAGGFNVAIVDANPQRGAYYFVEYSSNASFGGAITVPLLTSRNTYLPLGGNTLYFRCYSQFLGSNPSSFTIFGGSTPKSVTGGAAGTPAVPPTQGTGAGTSAGSNPYPPVGAGYGPVNWNPKMGPLRNIPGGIPY